MIPSEAYGTGVIKRFYRNKFLYIKDEFIAILKSVKHKKIERRLYNDLCIGHMLDIAIKNGYKLFDTGRLYGHSERKIGKAISKVNRKDFFLITKVSDVDLMRYKNKNSVSKNMDISLKNLKTQYVDAYLLHFPHGDWINIYHEIEEEYRKGRAKSIGVCNFDVQDLIQLMDNCKIMPMICQVELNPLNTKKELLNYCNKHKIVVMAHTPTGHLDRRICDSGIMNKLAKKYNKSVAQIIYKWHLQNGVIPIIASISKKHILENRNINDFKLLEDEMEAINALNIDYSFDVNNNKMNDCPDFIYNI